MTHDLGAHLAQTHNALVESWHTAGPEHVHDVVSSLSRSALVALVMANVGAAAINQTEAN